MHAYVEHKLTAISAFDLFEIRGTGGYIPGLITSENGRLMFWRPGYVVMPRDRGKTNIRMVLERMNAHFMVPLPSNLLLKIMIIYA